MYIQRLARAFGTYKHLTYKHPLIFISMRTYIHPKLIKCDGPSKQSLLSRDKLLFNGQYTGILPIRIT